MALQTDLSASPYFDDYSVNKNFYRILYRPGVALQTRELNQMQTIMQDQIDKFGRFVFKDGSVTEGCSFTFDDNYTYVKIQDNFANGFAFTISDFIGKNVYNDNGLKATIVNTVAGYESQDPDLNTLYIKYLNTSAFANGSTQTTFANGENLAIVTTANVAVGNVTVATVANSTGAGYAFNTTAGTIFKKGFFISVSPQTIIINKYDNYPDGKSVGFEAIENIITPESDSTLYDNAAGSPNYTAPGSHRLQLIPTLVTRSTTSAANTSSFFSLCDFKSGKPVSIKNTPQLASLGSEMAKRTYETNGNYVVYPFILSSEAKSTTDANNATYVNLVSSRGLGYVEGYRVEFVNNNKIDLRRATDYEALSSQVVSANFGYYVYVNDYCGEFDTGDTIVKLELHSVAKNALYGGTFLSGYSSTTKIGTAYARGFVYDSGTVGSWQAQYRLYLFNVQMLPGYNFSNVLSVQSVSGSSLLGVADIVQTYNGSTYTSTIQQGLYSNMVYPIGQKAIKLDGFNNTQYVYRAKASSSFANVTTTASMTLNLPTLHGTATEVVDHTGTLTGSSTSSFIVIPSTDGYSNNKSGTVSVSTTSNPVGTSNVTGSGTAFLTDFMVGDWIYINNNYKKEISFIANNTFLQVKVPFANTDTVSSVSYKKIFPVGVPIDFSKNNGTINRSIVATSSSVVYNLGESVNAAFQAVGYYDVLRSATVPIAKNIKKSTYVTINCASHPNGTTGPWSLGFPDVNKINAIYVSTSAYANSGVNYINAFKFDNGQRDSYYDLASISSLNSGLLTSDSRIVVDMDVFTYTQTAGVGFFTGNSYPVDANTSNTSAITIAQIPQFTAQDGSVFDLRDCIDFRPFATNTATASSNSSNWTTTATANPSSTLSFAAPYGQTYLPSADTNFQSDLQHYLKRIDRAILRASGELAIIEGAPSNKPIPSPEQAGAMTLGLVTVPPYPSLATQEAKTYGRYDYAITNTITQNKRYTMKDINTLSNKIDNLEYYTSLSMLETSAKDTLVRSGTTGQNRFQNGILVDAFAGHDIGNTLDPYYDIAIDPNKTELRPNFINFYRPMKFNSAASSGVVKKGNAILLSHTSTPYFYQNYASKYRNCIEGNIFTFKGEITFEPPGSTTPDMNKAPDVVVNIDLASNWVNLGASAFGQQWGAWNTTSQSTAALGPAATSSVTDQFGNITNTTSQQRTTTTTTKNQRTGTVMDVQTQTNNYNLGDKVTDVSILPYVKSMDINVTVHGLKPNTRVYLFMNNKDVNGWFQQKDSTFATLYKYYGGVPIAGSASTIPGYLKTGYYTDSTGSLYGVFTIPPNTFKATTLEMKIVDVSDLVTGANAITTQGTGTYYASNLSVTKGATILSAKEATLSVKEVTQQTTTTTVVKDVVQTVEVIPGPNPPGGDGGGGGGGGDGGGGGCGDSGGGGCQ